ncbi:MAG: T9SS type A sorting domain-containing protein [Ignavibacteria bacterium]|nr:T9SS type A sorting domain-containing protein [Ignavibacteria bacterium]
MSLIKTLKKEFLITVGDDVDNVGTLVNIDSLGNLIQIKYNKYDPESNVGYYTINNSKDTGFIITGQYKTASWDFANFLVLRTDKYLNFEPTEILNNNSIIDQYFLKVDVFPNPFNPMLNIKIHIRNKENVNVSLFDISGRKIYSISNILINSISTERIDADNLDLSSGIYFVQIKSENSSLIKKVIFLK